MNVKSAGDKNCKGNVVSNAQAQGFLLKDIVSAGSSNPSGFIVFKDYLFFVAANSADVREVWFLSSLDAPEGPRKVDGTENTQKLVVLQDKLLAVDGVTEEIYQIMIDGVDELLSPVISLSSRVALERDPDELIQRQLPSEYVLFQDQLFFYTQQGTRRYDVWKTDGESMTMVSTFPSMVLYRGEGMYISPAQSSKYLFFVAEVGVFQDSEINLFFTDGVSAPAIVPNSDQVCLPKGRVSYQEIIIDNGNKLLVVVDDKTPGACSEGGDAPRQRLAMFDLSTNEFALSFVDDLPDCDIYATIKIPNEDSVLLFLSCGSVWRTDGTPAGTLEVHESICLEANCGYLLVNTVFEDKVYFYGARGGLYVTDGTKEGTHLVLTVPEGSRLSQLVSTPDAVYVVVKLHDEYGKPMLDNDAAQLWIMTKESMCFKRQHIEWIGANDISYLDLMAESISNIPKFVPFQDGLVFTTNFALSAYNIEPRAIRFIDSGSNNGSGCADNRTSYLVAWFLVSVSALVVHHFVL